MSDPASGPSATSGEIMPGVVVACFDDTVAMDDAASSLTRAVPNLVLDRVVSMDMNMAVFRITDAASVADMVAHLTQRAGDLRLLWAEPNYVLRPTAKPNDPNDPYPNDRYYPWQWGLPRVGAQLLWDQPANNVRIAILDSGIPCDSAGNLTHPDLQNNIVLKRDYTGNGYNDNYGHGTQMAGICGADSNNQIGITGIAWNIKKFIYKVDDADRAVGSADMAGAIGDAVSDTPSGEKLVINASWAHDTDPSNALEKACRMVDTKGAILCASSGNDGYPDRVGFPAAYAATNNAVISVGAVDCNGHLAIFSNRSKTPGYVTLVAPGLGILSCVTAAESPIGFAYGDGTSQATAFASAMIAQVWARRGGTRDEIVSWIKANCIPLAVAIPSPQTGYGLITGIADTGVASIILNITGDDLVI